MAVEYRPYKPEDFEAVYALEEACFRPPFQFGRKYMRSLMRRENACKWIAEDEGGGLIAYLETLEVSPELRGRGTGGELLRRCEESARAAGAESVWLHVDAENAAAIGLYRAHGFERQGRVEGYYPEGRTAEVYAKRLAAP
jgi:ribosomal-protein-alanine N-acetyltransferase